MTLPAAWVVAAMQEDVAVKAFSFCLPGHRDNFRRLVFLVGLIISAIGGLYFALNCRSSDASPEAFALIVCSGSCFTWSTYLIGIALTLAIGSGVMMSVCLMSVLVVTGGFGLHWQLDHAILGHPFVVISLGILTGAIVWQRLGRSGWLRKRCGKPAAGFLSAMFCSSEQEERQIAAVVKFPEFPPTLDRRLLDIIRSTEYPALVKYIVGPIYTTLARLLLFAARTPVSILWMLLLAIIFLMIGYAPRFGLGFIGLLLLATTSDMNEGSPLFSHMLICGGRRERLCVATIFVAILAVLSTAILMLSVLTLNLLSPWLPEVRVAGFTLTFHPISLGLPMLAMIGYPVFGLVDFGFNGRRAGGMISLAVRLAVMPVAILCHVSAIPAKVAVSAAILSWLIFVLGLHRIAMRGDLVRR